MAVGNLGLLIQRQHHFYKKNRQIKLIKKLKVKSGSGTVERVRPFEREE
jgi:hypothetical protein